MKLNPELRSELKLVLSQPQLGLDSPLPELSNGAGVVTGPICPDLPCEIGRQLAASHRSRPVISVVGEGGVFVWTNQKLGFANRPMRWGLCVTGGPGPRHRGATQ